MDPLKLIITSKGNLLKKYGKNFSKVVTLLNKLKKADKAKALRTEIAFIDDAASMKKLKVKKAAASLSQRECKKAVDALYTRWNPAYIVIFGAQDVFPFQDLANPADDEDKIVPSDLPYACSASYGTSVNIFTGPSRVVGRIPDVPGNGDMVYVTTLIENIIRHKPLHEVDYTSYFAVSANVWKRSTELSLKSMFGSTADLLISPPASGKYPKTQLRQLTHFYNCHGASEDPNYYGQEGNNYPSALYSKDIVKKISFGTVVAAECCYGAQVYDPVKTGNKYLSIANQYLLQHAIAFMGSSTIAYGPADSQGLADLITQYFIKHVLKGASSGRAMLEAQQEFLTNSGPDLDPYELKTLAQFYLLGDPSLQPVDSALGKTISANNTMENRRMNLFHKGVGLKKSINPSVEITRRKHTYSKELSEVVKKVKMDKSARERVYRIPTKTVPATGLSKSFMQQAVEYRAFIKESKSKGTSRFRVLVVKETNDHVLGWRVYVSR
jgi:Peptidase family C25